VTADAKPVMSFVVARVCFRSNVAVELAAMAAVVKISTPSRAIVNVAAEAAELVTTILVTTVVVDAGTVYSVPDDVAAA
jgi:hypothetical protein